MASWQRNVCMACNTVSVAASGGMARTAWLNSCMANSGGRARMAYGIFLSLNSIFESDNSNIVHLQKYIIERRQREHLLHARGSSFQAQQQQQQHGRRLCKWLSYISFQRIIWQQQHGYICICLWRQWLFKLKLFN